MKKIRHVVIWVLVVCFFACISPVAFAVDSDYSLWEWLLNKNIPWLGDLSGCTEAPAGNHNFQYIPGEGTFCTYCGISYSDYSAAAYQQSLDEAQTTYIKDAGFYIWYDSISYEDNYDCIEFISLGSTTFIKTKYMKTYGTKVYFAHPYSAFERGSNENANRMIRRWYPKGTDFADVSAVDISRLQAWMNDYPRQILGGYSASEILEACDAS